MAKNPFKQQQEYDSKPNRNNFDLSNQNHLTMDFGKFVPFLCLPTVPGDSFKISSAIGLKMLPMVFPVQTRMRAQVSYFWVPTRILWKEFKDWISGHRPELVHPYIVQDASFFSNGSLSDYLGVPTSIVNSDRNYNFVPALSANFTSYLSTERQIGFPDSPVSAPFGIYFKDGEIAKPVFIPYIYADEIGAVIASGCLGFGCEITDPLVEIPKLSPDPGVIPDYIVVVADRDRVLDWSFHGWKTPEGQNARNLFSAAAAGSKGVDFLVVSPQSDTYQHDVIEFANQGLSNGSQVHYFVFFKYQSYQSLGVADHVDVYDSKVKQASFSFIVHSEGTNNSDTSVIGTPFSKESSEIRLNALPYRAYESIYNAYFRSTVNDPFKVDGVEEYNRFVTNDESGADTTPYSLFSRNWELDPFTSALPSPQQGAAPLVGMSNLRTMQITDDDGNVVDYDVTTAEDGSTIVKLSATSPNASNKTNRIAMDIAQSGMSINDFRNVNALQRWLETNIRKGYRYMDFISGHHGVTPTHVEMDMPLFLGGYTRDVDVNSVTNLSQGDLVLGDYAGTANLFSGSSHEIHHYCDDYGYLIGLICVYPDAVYSQNLPKDFLKSKVLDYYFPEFSNLGMQPITYEEITPIQRWLEKQTDQSISLQDTFGYQRPNYDMIQRQDEAHGNFRGDMSNYLIHRSFSRSPELGHDFIAIDDGIVSPVFTISKGHHIVGQIINQIFAKRPVPRVSIPRLE